MAVSGCSSTGSISETTQKVKNGDLNHLDVADPYLNLTRDDYKHMNAPKNAGKPPKQGEALLEIEKGAPPIPKIADILAAPRPPKIGENHIVSIAVTEDVPLKDVLIELAKLADIDIELDAGITGGINFIAKDKPFNEVIERIASLTGLRYTMKSGVLRVERDTPYIKNYALDFLNLDRESTSSVSISTGVSTTGTSGSSSGSSGSSSGSASNGSSGNSGSSASSGSSSSNGSSSTSKSKSTGDFWKALDSGIQQILNRQEVSHASANTLQSVTPADNGAANGKENAGTAKTMAAAAVIPAQPVPQSASKGTGGASTEYTINREAGVLTVNGTARQQELIERFVNEIKKNAASQVLIEAKIIEVDLNDQYASGVNWSLLASKLSSGVTTGAISTSFATALPTPATSILPAGNFFQLAAGPNQQDVIKLLEGFGTSRTLSSPRLHAINNQVSTLTFTKNIVYFSINVSGGTITPATATTAQVITPPSFTSTSNTVPVGILMTLIPSIDVDDNEVTLSVRPTLTSQVDQAQDPAFDLEVASLIGNGTVSGTVATTLAATHNYIPIIQVRELDSTLKLKSGQIMVIGGLMQQEASNTDTGVPFASGIPVIGNLFKDVAKSTHNKELVILIKATIVDAHGSLNNTDMNVFRKFSNDPRPVSF